MNCRSSFFFLAAGLVMLALCEAAENPSIHVVTFDAAVKGFPLVMKVTATGRQVVPRMSLFDEHAGVVVRLKLNDEDGREYLIQSSKGEGMVYTNREGEQIDAGRLYRVSLGAGDERSMLLDLASLRPEIGNGITIDDVPPGKYMLSVKFGFSGLESKPVPLVLKNPTRGEKALADMMLFDEHTKIRRTWCGLLRAAWPVRSVTTSTASGEAIAQLSFHQLLGRVLSSDTLEKVRDQDIESAAVPDWLAPEKDALVLSIAIAAEPKEQADNAAAELVRQHPDLKWRFDELQKDKAGEFLRFARFLRK